MNIEGGTFDDLLRRSLVALLERGRPIRPSKGPALEVIGASMRLANPLARFSRTESRGVLSAALGETLWYLSGSDEFDVIEHYIKGYRTFCGTPPHIARSEAAYGPRLKEQMAFIFDTVRKTDTRNAVISIYREADHRNEYDVPCTCTLQFLPRSGVLHALAHMRSNDVYRGMPHDVFAFTMLQEIVARSAGLELGAYVHQVGSFHLYDADADRARRYLAGGIADDIPMDPMPAGDPGPGLDWLLKAEAPLRTGGALPDSTGIAPYWQDLARLLQARPLREAGDRDGLVRLRDRLHSGVFRTFLQDEIARA